jgi:hypothetical protein
MIVVIFNAILVYLLIPWMGSFVSKVLSIWSVLILIGIVQFEFKIGFGGAVTCVVLGWLVSLLFTNTIGGPVVKLRNTVFQKVSGSSLARTNEDILLRFAGATLRSWRRQWRKRSLRRVKQGEGAIVS